MNFPIVPLGDVTTIIAGQSPPSSTYNEDGVGFPFFQGKADFGEVHPIARKWCVAPKRVAERGDILIFVRAPVGPTNIAERRCCIGRGLAAIRPDETVALRDFVFWSLKQRESDLVTMGQGSTFAAIGQKHLATLKVPLPPLDEQRRIVGILNRAAKIERLRKQAQKRLREFISALFVKMFGDPFENPMGWKHAYLGALSEVQGGLQVTKKRDCHPIEAPYLRVANVFRDRLDLNEIKYMRITERELERVQLKRGDLLVVEGHGNESEIGRAGIWDGRICSCVHQNHLIRVRPDQSRILPEFACAYLNSSSGRQHLLRSGKTTSGLNTITTSNVKSCTIFVPPIDLQRRHTRIVQAARVRASFAEAGSSTTLALSASLMSRLLGAAA